MAPRSLYKEAYNNEVIEYLALGHSVTAFAGHIGVGRKTVYDWAEAHPDFYHSMQLGITKAVSFWEDRLLECAQSGKGNVTAIIFGLKNRAHEDWRDVHKLEHTGKDGGAIEVADMSTADRARALAAFVAKTRMKDAKPDGVSAH